jgi:imidazole glycerol phosphate synthase subunit HisF
MVAVYLSGPLFTSSYLNGAAPQVFQETGAAAALAAGIFHRREVGINEVKQHMADNRVPARIAA